VTADKQDDDCRGPSHVWAPEVDQNNELVRWQCLRCNGISFSTSIDEPPPYVPEEQ
jgi:hypothetical protein